eukprot:gene9861-10908_t
MMLLILGLFLSLSSTAFSRLTGSFSSPTSSENNIVVVRQNTERVGHVISLNTETGKIKQESNTTITFDWPYVELTTDKTSQRTYIVSFPDGSDGPILYEFDSQLKLTQTWDKTDYSFFDLQYAANQKTLYGIKVVSTYGRVISRFTATPGADAVTAEELFTLPYMWYVNAPSFDQVNERYFALCSYFPGHPETVSDQKIITCDTKVPTANCTVVDIINTAGAIEFIAYSSLTKNLYFSSLLDGKILVGVLDYNLGVVRQVLTSFPAIRLGPLTVEDKANYLSFFVISELHGSWKLYDFGFSDPHSHLIRVFDETDAFAGCGLVLDHVLFDGCHYDEYED